MNATLEGEEPEERQEGEEKRASEGEKVADENILGFIIKEEGLNTGRLEQPRRKPITLSMVLASKGRKTRIWKWIRARKL